MTNGLCVAPKPWNRTQLNRVLLKRAAMEAMMWVIVAMNLAFGDTPKVTVMPGAEYQTKDECIRAAHVHADFNSEQGGVRFSFCVPKDSVQIGRAEPHGDKPDQQ